MVNTSSTLSLAALEYLAHIDPEDVPDDLVAMELRLAAESSIEARIIADMPADWRTPVPPVSCQRIGDEWVAGGRSLGLLVPSVLIPGETNLLLNPRHAEMASVEVVRVERFVFDVRLVWR